MQIVQIFDGNFCLWLIIVRDRAAILDKIQREGTHKVGLFPLMHKVTAGNDTSLIKDTRYFWTEAGFRQENFEAVTCISVANFSLSYRPVS